MDGREDYPDLILRYLILTRVYECIYLFMIARESREKKGEGGEKGKGKKKVIGFQKNI